MTIFATGLGVFMIFLDALVVNVALPDIQAHFGVGEAGLQWVVTIYAAGMAVLMMASATLADRFGRRRIYLIGVVAFGVGTIGSGLATDFGILVAARGVQGTAAAVVNVSSLALVSAAFSDSRQRVRAIGIWTAVGTVGLALGPTVGGVLTEFVTWRAVFLVNVPAIILAIGLSLRFVAESRETTNRGLDPPGQALFAVTVGALAFAVIEGQNLGWDSFVILGLFAVFGVALAGFIVHELRTPSPMMDLRLFAHRAYTLGIVTIFFGLFCAYGMLLVVTQYLQNVRDYSPLEAGLLMLPFALASMYLSPRAGRIAARVGSRKPILAGQFLLLVGLVAIIVGMSSTIVVMAVGFALAGSGAALIVTPVTGLAMSSVQLDRAGMASGILSTQRGLGSTIGYAVLGAVVAVWLGATLDSDLTEAVPDPDQRARAVQKIIDDASPAAYVSAMTPGRPITYPDPVQESAIRAAADRDFVRGIQLSLGLAAALSALVLVVLLLGFHERSAGRAPSA